MSRLVAFIQAASVSFACITSGWAAELITGAEAKTEGVLFSEGFEDADLAGRNWYDGLVGPFLLC